MIRGTDRTGALVFKPPDDALRVTRPSEAVADEHVAATVCRNRAGNSSDRIGIRSDITFGSTQGEACWRQSSTPGNCAASNIDPVPIAVSVTVVAKCAAETAERCVKGDVAVIGCGDENVGGAYAIAEGSGIDG